MGSMGLRRGFENVLSTTTDGLLDMMSLGSDHTAEHEWGIQILRERHGIKPVTRENNGIEARRVKTTTGLELLTTSKGVVLYSYPYKLDIDSGYLTKEVNPYKEEKWVGAWSDGGFAIKSEDKDSIAHIKDLHRAFLEKDVGIWIGGGGPFKNGGLVLGVISRISNEFKESMKKKDIDGLDLLDASKKTGIEELLKSSGKGWYALSPNWSRQFNSVIRGNGKIQVQTAHPVMYFLNPHKQDIYESGYFTVEELLLWAENKGPVVRGAPRRR